MRTKRWIFFPALAILIAAIGVAKAANQEPPKRKTEAPLTGKILFKEDFETKTERKLRVASGLPEGRGFEPHFIGITNEKARSGTHSAKVDLTTIKNGISVYLAENMNVPLEKGKGCIVSMYLWIDEASPQAPARPQLGMVTDSPSGVSSARYDLHMLSKPTGGWVKVERELTSWLIPRLDASGEKIEGLRIDAVDLRTFTEEYKRRFTVYVDDITVSEVPASVVEDFRRRQMKELAGKARTFRSYPEVEDFFPWGVAADLYNPGDIWYNPPKSTDPERPQQLEAAREASDWILRDLKRHYCNVSIRSGGLMLPNEGEEAVEQVKYHLDKHAEYGMKNIPSTYLTQHYEPTVSRKDCEKAMRRVTGLFKDHQGLLAYWLVDEPSAATAEDFYWGKRLMESLDPNHPSLCTCNGIDPLEEFAPSLPITVIDYYPIKTNPGQGAGAWGVGDMVRRARELGARRVWVIPQVFGTGSWRSPTVPELRIQIFSALAEGATGFIFYSYANRPYWAVSKEKGRLVDAFGNASPNWKEVKRLGPYLRSAGPLLIGAKRLGNEAAIAQTGNYVVVSDVGRRRPWVAAHVFSDPKQKARYVVVYNNSRFCRANSNVFIRDVAKGEKVINLFSLNEVPGQQAGRFRVRLEPGDGTLYAVAAPGVLNHIRSEVWKRRFEIEQDLMDMELGIAQKMGRNVAPARKSLKRASILAADNKFPEAINLLGEARFLLKQASRVNTEYWKVHEDLEEARRTLGGASAILDKWVGIYSKDHPLVKELIQRMVALADDFYSLHGELIRSGPKGLEAKASQLFKKAAACKQEVETFFGP